MLIAIIFEAHADEKTPNPSFDEFFGLGKPYVADGYFSKHCPANGTSGVLK